MSMRTRKSPPQPCRRPGTGQAGPGSVRMRNKFCAPPIKNARLHGDGLRAAAAAFADGRHAGPPVIGRILWRGMCTPVFLCAGFRGCGVQGCGLRRCGLRVCGPRVCGLRVSRTILQTGRRGVCGPRVCGLRGYGPRGCGMRECGPAEVRAVRLRPAEVRAARVRAERVRAASVRDERVRACGGAGCEVAACEGAGLRRCGR